MSLFQVENDKQRGSSEEKDSDLAPCPPGPPPLAIETKIRSIHISPPTVPPPSGSAHSHFGHNRGSDPGNGDCVLKKISSLGISKKSWDGSANLPLRSETKHDVGSGQVPPQFATLRRRGVFVKPTSTMPVATVAPVKW